MFHQQGRTSQGRLQGSDLLVQQQPFPLTGLIGSQRIIHFAAGVEQCLLLPAAHGRCDTEPPPVLY